MQDQDPINPLGARYPRIDKPPFPGAVRPNLTNYAETRAHFSWDDARSNLQGLPDGRGLNIAHEAVDRRVLDGRGEHIALRWIGREGARREFSYAALSAETSRFANALAGLGVAAGDPVFLLMGRIPELYIAALGALKQRCVVCPLFSAFGPEPLTTRLALGGVKVLVTTASLYRRKIAPLRASLPTLRNVIVVEDETVEKAAGVIAWPALLAGQSAVFEIPDTDPEDRALLHFTSGTTGKPKGVLHVHAAVITHHMTGFHALDLHPGDVFWCTADPGWVTGTSYGIIAPLTHGVTNVVVEAEFDAESWYRILQEEAVTVWYTAPTAIRMMMKLGAEAVRRHALPHLRFMSSVGEPLNPEAVVWSREAFGRPFHDNWWQTETGGIMIANYAALPIKPGSMGLPLPGIEASVVRRLPSGELEHLDTPMDEGELVLRRGWPSMMRD